MKFFKDKNIYDRIELNLGIKKFIKKIEFIPAIERLITRLDNWIIFPIYELLKKYFYRRINYHYGASYRMDNFKSQNLDNKTGGLGYGLIHYSFIRNLRPRRVLCIGSMYGFVPFMCALACEENKKGVVDFVDAGYDINDPNDINRHNWGQGFWKKNLPTKQFSLMKTEKYINTYVMTSANFAKKFNNRVYDYIYVDGDHSYKGVKMDYELFWPKLKRNGFIAFHDTDNKGVHGSLYYNVSQFCQESIYTKKNYLHFPNSESGLVIVQKTAMRNKK